MIFFQNVLKNLKVGPGLGLLSIDLDNPHLFRLLDIYLHSSVRELPEDPVICLVSISPVIPPLIRVYCVNKS
jgi:hypothetical protein